MKVAINRQIHLKLINKIFVKKTNCTTDHSVYKDYFWFWHYICNLTQQKGIIYGSKIFTQSKRCDHI